MYSLWGQLDVSVDKVFSVPANDCSLILEPTYNRKERTNFPKLSSDYHTCVVVHASLQHIINNTRIGNSIKNEKCILLIITHPLSLIPLSFLLPLEAPSVIHKV